MGSTDCMLEACVQVLLAASTTLTVFWKLLVLLQVSGFISHVPKEHVSTLAFSEPA